MAEAARPAAQKNFFSHPLDNSHNPEYNINKQMNTYSYVERSDTMEEHDKNFCESENGCSDCPRHIECGGKNIELVKRFADKMITEEEAYYVSELFKALSDMTRVRILFSLLGGEMCVCDIQELVGVTQSAVSHQLRTLKQAGLVKYRRDGKSLYYSIADSHVSTMLATGLEHISE